MKAQTLFARHLGVGTAACAREYVQQERLFFRKVPPDLRCPFFVFVLGIHIVKCIDPHFDGVTVTPTKQLKGSRSIGPRCFGAIENSTDSTVKWNDFLEHRLIWVSVKMCCAQLSFALLIAPLKQRFIHGRHFDIHALCLQAAPTAGHHACRQIDHITSNTTRRHGVSERLHDGLFLRRERRKGGLAAGDAQRQYDAGEEASQRWFHAASYAMTVPFTRCAILVIAHSVNSLHVSTL